MASIFWHLHCLFLTSSFGFRLETLQRSLEWVKAWLITVPAADQLLRDTVEYIAEVTNNDRVHGQQGSSI